MVANAIESRLADRADHLGVVTDNDPAAMQAAATAASVLAERITHAPERARALINCIVLRPGTLRIALDAVTLADALGVAPDHLATDTLAINTGFTLRRRGVETRIIAGRMAPQPDPTMMRALGPSPLLAREDLHRHRCRRHRARREPQRYLHPQRLQPAFLEPAIEQAILDGTQPPDLTLERIIRSNLPLDWQAQLQALGFTERQ